MKSVASLITFTVAALSLPLPAQVCDGISPVEATSLVSVVVETGLTGDPLLVTAPRGDKSRIFIVEQDGFIWVKQRGSAPGARSLYLDLSATVNSGGFEQGLLGMDFAPDFEASGLFHVSYTGGTGSGTTELATYRQDPMNPNQALPTPVASFFSVNQPDFNHNGGNIRVGPDGFVYFGFGDGGGANDAGPGHSVCGNAQDDTNLLGTMIRIDPTGDSPNPPDCGTGTYTIPEGNPKADGPGGVCDEIWANGLRNPWRWDFDPLNGDLYIGDVGQNCWEEVNWVPGTSVGNENYGWRAMEGSHCFDPGNNNNCDPSAAQCIGSVKCDDPGLTLPVLESPQTSGACSMTGGLVYRGCRITNLQGHYFWSDFCDGRINSLLIDAGVPTMQMDWTDTVDPAPRILTNSMTSFGRDGEGELYACDRGGTILKLVPPLSDFEVSGSGVLGPDMFLVNKTVQWTWENLQLSSSHPIRYYSIYGGTPDGNFDCIHSTAQTRWIGDPSNPGPGGLFAYLVTATNFDDVETGGGAGRILNTACAAP